MAVNAGHFLDPADPSASVLLYNGRICLLHLVISDTVKYTDSVLSGSNLKQREIGATAATLQWCRISA
ncbi:MAG: hypothetical protein ACMG6H_06630, partial [Acidobacteriota bacterium]